jgi:ABC-2 type transport system permease protein
MFQRMRQMLIKEFIQVFRDPRMRIVIFVIPCVQVLVIGYAVTTDVKHVPHGRLRPGQQRGQPRADGAVRPKAGYFDVVAKVDDPAGAAT